MLAQARASVDFDSDLPTASLSEPSRPFTPAAMDARLSLVESFNSSSRKYGSRERLDPMALRANRSQNDRKAKPDEISPPILSEEFLSVSKSINDGMDSLTGAFASCTAEMARMLISSLNEAVEAMAKCIKKNPETVFGDPDQCMHRLLLWLTATFNETTHDVVRHVICRYIFRIHLSIYAATNSRAVADTLVLISKDLCGFFKTEAVSDPSFQDLFKLDTELITDFLRIVWGTSDDMSSRAGFTTAGVERDRGDPDSLSTAGGKRRGSCGASVTLVSAETMELLLRAAEFAAGSIKEISNTKENRRRMVHLETMSVSILGLQRLISLRDFLESRSSRAPHVFGLAIKASKAAEGTDDDTVNTIIRNQIFCIEKISIQILSGLRNFALDESGREHLLALGVFPLLCRVIKTATSLSSAPCGASHDASMNDKASELLLSCVRVTAKLSLFEDFREQIYAVKPPVHLASLVGILTSEGTLMNRVMNGDQDVNWPSWHTWPLLSRTAFTLGNFTTTNDSNRHYIAIRCACIDHLVGLLQCCTASLVQLGADAARETTEIGDEGKEDNSEADDKQAEQELADATLKMLRLLANLSINNAPGNDLGSRHAVLDLLLNLLKLSSSSGEHEELLLNAVATSTNIGFYACKLSADQKSDAKMDALLMTISLQLSEYLFHDNNEIIAESLRALGNFTRLPHIVHRFCRLRIDEAIIMLLSHKVSDVRLAAAGVLVNVTGHSDFFDESLVESFAEDSTAASSTSKLNALSLTTLLRKASVKDVAFLTLVLQIYYNCIIHVPQLKKSSAVEASVNTVMELQDIICGDLNRVSVAAKIPSQISSFQTVSNLVLRGITDL